MVSEAFQEVTNPSNAGEFMRNITRRGFERSPSCDSDGALFLIETRAKVIGCYTDEKSVVKLVLAMFI